MMRSRTRLRLVFCALLLTTLGITSCRFQSPSVRSIPVQAVPTPVRSSVKAHMLDGSTVIFPNGVHLQQNRIIGAGRRYPLLGGGVAVASIPLDSIVGMEAYDSNLNEGATVAASGATAVVGIIGSIALLKAIFGSCPTFYADSAGAELLQGEGFSYSVAPLLEQRDVDRLRLAPSASGPLVLTVRNEALETHYINHVEVLEAEHGADEMVLPDQGGRPVALSRMVELTSVRDRSGRDISGEVQSTDQVVFATARATLDGVVEADLDDWIEFDVPVPAGADSVAIIMEMRNSLLNTVLLYDQILAAPGIKSLDYLGKDLENISGAVELAKWYSSHMGMRISVRDGNSWRRVARIGDSGPIAYHQLVVMIPAVTNGGNVVRVRLAFVADDWRIDAIRASSSWRRPVVRRLAPTRVEMFDSTQNATARAALVEPDTRYLSTSPGQSFRLVFDREAGGSRHRTYMLASQGYYTEWVRGSWIRNATGVPFQPTSASLLKAIKSWRSRQDELEKQFYSSRVATAR